MARQNWTRKELIVAFNYYCRTPFGRLHHSNPEIVELARLLGRTPNSVAMKLVNFASLDPVLKARQIAGLSNISKLDREIWREFCDNWERLAYESGQAVLELSVTRATKTDLAGAVAVQPTGPSSGIRSVRVRLVQSFFRQSVMSSYEAKCAFCSLSAMDLLNASHIIPWSKDIARRADPTNGICLCAFHDRAFDRGLMALSDQLRIVLSPRLKNIGECSMKKVALRDVEGKEMTQPIRFAPDVEAIRYHRTHIFH